MKDHKIRLTDLFPVGYERYKQRNNLATAYSTNERMGIETETDVRWRAEVLNQYHLLLNGAIIGTGIVAGMAGACLGIIGAQKVYHTLEQVIDKLF
jgi:hypothetical protein